MFVQVVSSRDNPVNNSAEIAPERVHGLHRIIKVLLTVRLGKAGEFWPALSLVEAKQKTAVVCFFGAAIPAELLPPDTGISVADYLGRSTEEIHGAICSFFAQHLASQANVRVEGHSVFLDLAHGGCLEGSVNGSLNTLAA